MSPAKKRPATSPLDSDTEIREILNNLNKKQEEIIKKQGEMNKKQTKMAEMIKELHQQATKPKKESYIEKFPMKNRTFSMKHTLKDVSKVLDGTDVFSEEENFYGLNWYVSLEEYEEGVIGCFLHCSHTKLQNPWMVDTEFTLLRSGEPKEWHNTLCVHTFTNTDDDYGITSFMTQKELLSAVNDEVTVEVKVSILGMKGVLEPRTFDESHRQFSDVILTVDGEDFYVLKKFLASRSSVFNSMFFSSFEEAGKDQIELTGVDARDFQNFLETVHGEATIEDSNVEGLLHLADFYISPFALKECEKFLLRDSKMTPGKKYQLSKKYKLEKLTEKCISEMEDIDVIRAEIANEENSRSTLQKLGARLLELYDKLKEASVQREVGEVLIGNQETPA